jgi:hypothetical protein
VTFRTALTCALLVALTAVVAATVRVGGDLGHPGRLPAWYAAAWALFAAAVWSLRTVPARTAVALVVVGGTALALAALSGPPRTSDDMFRYAWDGRVQAAGISPYAYPPDAPALARLRDTWLFPPGGACHAWDLHAVGELCTRINRPGVHTIYPPVAEAWYLVVHALSPPGARYIPFQIAGAVLVLATTLVLVRVLRRRGDPRSAALWAWCPAVPFAAVNDAHVDTLGVLLTVAGLATTTRLRGWLLGGGIAVKLLPVLALPGALSGLLRRGRRTAERPGPVRRFRSGSRRPARPLGALRFAPSSLFFRTSDAKPPDHPHTTRCEDDPPPCDRPRLPPLADPTGNSVPALAEAARVLLPALAVVVLAYVPYVALSGFSVLGYLPGYLREEGYDAGSVGRFALLRLVVPDAWAAPVAVALVAVAALYVLRRGDRERPWRGALLVTGTALLATSPGYYWYALLVVALVALDGRWEWLAVPAAGTALYLAPALGAPGEPAQLWSYGLAALVVGAGALVRGRSRQAART